MFEILTLIRSDTPPFFYLTTQGSDHGRASITMTFDCVSVSVSLLTSTFSLLLRVALFLHRAYLISLILTIIIN